MVARNLCPVCHLGGWPPAPGLETWKSYPQFSPTVAARWPIRAAAPPSRFQVPVPVPLRSPPVPRGFSYPSATTSASSSPTRYHNRLWVSSGNHKILGLDSGGYNRGQKRRRGSPARGSPPRDFSRGFSVAGKGDTRVCQGERKWLRMEARGLFWGLGIWWWPQMAPVCVGLSTGCRFGAGVSVAAARLPTSTLSRQS
jgi:hypothetical protein